MNFDIVLKDVDLSPLAEEWIERRVEKIRQRLDQESRVRVTLVATHGQFGGHVRLVCDGCELVGTGTSRENVVAAFDEAAARVERRIVRRARKQRRTDRGLRGAGHAARSERAWARWETA